MKFTLKDIFKNKSKYVLVWYDLEEGIDTNKKSCDVNIKSFCSVQDAINKQRKYYMDNMDKLIEQNKKNIINNDYELMCDFIFLNWAQAIKKKKMIWKR